MEVVIGIGIIGIVIVAKLRAGHKAKAAEAERRETEWKAEREAERKAAAIRKAEAERRAEWEAKREAERKAIAKIEAEREAERKAAEANKQWNRISYNPQATYLTKEGEANLRQELKNLVEVKRPALTQALATAAGRESKVKKNADYHDTKERQGFTEGRIQHIEAILRHAIVVEDEGPSDEVKVGSTVIIREDGTNEDEEYKIVGSAEANPRERKISQKSPIGKALLGKKKGRKVKVRTPDGELKFKIVDIR